MSWQYASSFPTGFEEVVAVALNHADSQSSVELIQDGLVIFSSQLKPQEIKNLPFFNNTFIVLALQKFEHTDNTQKITEQLFSASYFSPLKPIVHALGFKNFRIMVTKENQVQSMPSFQRGRLESMTASQLNLQIDRTLPDTELWFFIRRDGTCFSGLRLTKREKAQRGELGKEITYLLNLLSQPKESDIFLDPFAGSGAIPLTRAKYWPYQQILVSDIDQQKVDEVSDRLKSFPNVKVTAANALMLSAIADNSIDAIVTDPPWGFFEPLPEEPVIYYTKMLQEFKRVLTQEGRVVLLTARKEEMNEALKQQNWPAAKMINVLVSGKKAGVFVLKK